MFIAYTASNLHATWYGDRKWSKQRRTRRLGPMVSVFFFSFVFIDTNDCLLHIQLQIYMLRNMETGGRLKRQEMAQTTLDTSFGPCGECIFFPFIFIDTNACLLHIQLLIYILRDIETDGRLRLWERAQTTLICALVDNIEFFFFHIF